MSIPLFPESLNSKDKSVGEIDYISYDEKRRIFGIVIKLNEKDLHAEQFFESFHDMKWLKKNRI